MWQGGWVEICWDLKRHCVEKKKDHTCFNALFKCEKMALMRCDTKLIWGLGRIKTMTVA